MIGWSARPLTYTSIEASVRYVVGHVCNVSGWCLPPQPLERWLSLATRRAQGRRLQLQRGSNVMRHLGGPLNSDLSWEICQIHYVTLGLSRPLSHSPGQLSRRKCMGPATGPRLKPKGQDRISSSLLFLQSVLLSSRISISDEFRVPSLHYMCHEDISGDHDWFPSCAFLIISYCFG